MKKRTLKERKEDFKKAYYEGLKQQGLVDTVEKNVDKTVDKVNKTTTKKTTTKKKEVEK